MADFTKVAKALEQRGFHVRCFAAGEAACAYLEEKLAGKTVGIGGSMTAEELGLDRRLTAVGCQVIWHWKGGSLQQAAVAQAYLTSVNALAETGELINIDGSGNRVASMVFGHEEVYYIVGRNKLAPDYDAALWRARNVASPKNARRLGKDTPCAAKADRCYDCKSPQRICRALSVLWAAPVAIPYSEVLLVDEPLGY